MNKTSKIRKTLELYGFQQNKSRNCFISYAKEFCFQIKFIKVGYGSRWAIEYSVHMLNAKAYELYNCPDKFNIYLTGNEVTLKEWDSNGERNPDKHSDSMIFIIKEYIMPYFERVNTYTSPDDFGKYITKRKESYGFEEKFVFRPHRNICYIDNSNVLEVDTLSPLLNYMSMHQYEFRKKDCQRNNIEIIFLSRDCSHYVIAIIEKGLFLSYDVLSVNDFETINDNSLDSFEIQEYKTVNIDKIRYYSDTLGFEFGWFIADCINGQNSINNSINNLDSLLRKRWLKE